ncbi:conserved Plasmodium protein, unknown function [Plasmodium reichenowi]|uniref:Tetratricopeptide repeat protein n=1 Tax=Plasmodium reichenowi TaxID=5854 RepID=A0A060RZG3_PLARE|nr:conserved Plasmodium protein, unknown function [Plasmodium reichenowi]
MDNNINIDDDFNIDVDYIKKLSEKYKHVDHPLFMDELPKNLEENEDLEALYKIITSEDNPLILAQDYKEVGNDYFKDGIKYYDDAVISYNKGIDILNNYLKSLDVQNKNNNRSNNNKSNNNNNNNKNNNNNNNKNNNSNNNNNNCDVICTNLFHSNNINNKTKDDVFKQDVKEINNTESTGNIKNNDILKNDKNKNIKIDINDVKILLSDLYCNRAIIHYKKKKYIKCLDDCKNSFSFNNKKYKSLYFGILSCNNMEMYHDACKYINKFDELLKNIQDIESYINIQEYEKLKKDIFEKYEDYLRRKKKAQDERKKIEEQEKKKINQIENILKKRNIQTLPNVYDNNNNIIPVLYLDENMYIHFTVFLIYYEFNIIETILDFAESQCIMDYYDIIKKRRDNQILYCYIEFPNDTFYMINNYFYMCDIMNKIKKFTHILSIHIIENDVANINFKINKNITYL